MMMKFLILPVFIMISCSSSNNSQDYDNPTELEDKNDSLITEYRQFIGDWEYEYPHNAASLIENHYITFKVENKNLIGIYYGTSDDFDVAREGYYPGFFVQQMDKLNIDSIDDSFSFQLQIDENSLFTEPIPLTGNTDVGKNIEKWNYGLEFNNRKYQGHLSNDTLWLESQGIDRFFLRKK